MLFAEDVIACAGSTDVEPSIRVTNSFEHLRHEVGRKERSEVYDDGNYEEEPMHKLKAFHDNTEAESLTVERWNTAVFEGHGGRLACVNPYAKEFEPNASEIMLKEGVTHDTFYKMMRPAFSDKANEQHIMAIFKRTHIILHTQRFVYCRVASQQHSDVPRVPYPTGLPEPDIFVGDCKERLGLFKLGAQHLKKAPTVDFEWGKTFLHMCKDNRVPPRTNTILSRSPFKGATCLQEMKPRLDVGGWNSYFPSAPLVGKRLVSLPPDDAGTGAADVTSRAKVKLERGQSGCNPTPFPRQISSSASSAGVVDLSTPSPKRARTDACAGLHENNAELGGSASDVRGDAFTDADLEAALFAEDVPDWFEARGNDHP